MIKEWSKNIGFYWDEQGRTHMVSRKYETWENMMIGINHYAEDDIVICDTMEVVHFPSGVCSYYDPRRRSAHEQV